VLPRPSDLADRDPLHRTRFRRRGRNFALPRGERLYRLAYLTCGAKAPAFWEATVYLGDTGWKVMDLSVGTDKIFEKAEGYR
jgi:hypothetical protein